MGDVLNGKTSFLISGEMFFCSIWVFFHEHPRITGLQGKREAVISTAFLFYHG